MGVIKRKKKKAKNGYVYEVNFTYKVNGISQRYWKSGFETKKEALNHEAIKKAELQEYGNITKNCKKTLNEVYKEFLENGTSQYQSNTIYNTSRDYNHAKDSLGPMIITHIDYTTLQNYFNKRKDQGIETNKNIKKALNRILNYAIKVGYIKTNPISLVTVSGIQNKREYENILPYEDFSSLVYILKNNNDFNQKAFGIAIEIGYYTGLRISEVLALNKNDIDFENDMINVNKKLQYKGLKKHQFYVTEQMKSKTSQSKIPLATILKQSLLEWFNENPYDVIICDSKGYYVNPNVLSSKVKQVAKNIGVSFHFHMLRHTFATNIVSSNVDLKTAQELMRHANINTTLSIYTHVQDDHKKQVINDIFNITCGENVVKTN